MSDNQNKSAEMTDDEFMRVLDTVDTLPTNREEEREVAIKAKAYLKEYGVWLNWEFDEDFPPSPEVKEFLEAWDNEIFNANSVVEAVVDGAIANIEVIWLDNDPQK